MIQAQSCTFAASVLNASPFSLPWGSPVIALMSAQNVYGSSASQYASGTAIIVTIPDAPLSLANNPTITNAQRVGITWTAGAANGGTPVLDYSILWDQGTGNWVTRIAGLTTTSYTISQLSMGSTYSFRVIARNSFGFSNNSTTVSILAAQTPSTPTAPVTSVSGTNVVVTWTAPLAMGSTITAYLITF